MKLHKYFNIYRCRNLLFGARSGGCGKHLLASPCQPVSQSVSQSVNQSVSQAVCLSVCLSVCLYVPTFVRVSVAAIGRIFVNFETGKIDEDLLRIYGFY
jgi:hypothetical protein